MGPPKTYWHGVGHSLLAMCTETNGEEKIYEPFDSVSTLKDDPATVYGIPELKEQIGNTRSDDAFDFLKSCLAECKNHRKCGKIDIVNSVPTKGSSSNALNNTSPSRLIDLMAFSPQQDGRWNDVRLVEPDDKATHLKYTTLTHCWGSGIPKASITTLSSLVHRKERIAMSELTPTFQDAIEISRRLGIRYLWIDALCIVQDSTEDWAAESTKMGRIYQNSALTISADLGPDGDAGCFNTQGVPRHEKRGTSITTTNADGISSTIFIVSLTSESLHEIDKSSPLSKRGWTMQERLSSTKIAHFTPSQLIWECKEMYRFQDMLPVLSFSVESSARVESGFPTFSALIRQDHLSRGTVDLATTWYQDILCSAFSRRQFTIPSDRLVAVAGIAQVFQPYIKNRYLAGLWESSLTYGLSWHRENMDQTTTPEPVQNRRSPTWSWASHDGEIAWDTTLGDFVPEDAFHLTATTATFHGKDADAFGPLTEAQIGIRGRLTHAEVSCKNPLAGTSYAKSVYVEIKLEYSEPDEFCCLGVSFRGDLYVDYLSEMKDWQEPERFKALVLGCSEKSEGKDRSARTYLLVLEPAVSREPPCCYRRVGVATIRVPVSSRSYLARQCFLESICLV